MIKKKTPTASRRRHAFKSFRERIDAIRIEPSLNLTKRALDYVEVSHFLTTLNHWEECNLLGNFVAFVDATRPLVQSLPQLLFHKQKVWQLLRRHISEGDRFSLQPLLELLTQFIHDLGPEFMEFYAELLALLLDIATRAPEIAGSKDKGARTAAARADANLLEWTFTTLAHLFKYEQRQLSQDLELTLDGLLPVLSDDATTKRESYLTRFAAEALLFLIRKQKPAQLEHTIDLCITKQVSAAAMTTLFTEAITLVQQLFHSKGMAILDTLGAKVAPAIVADVVLALLAHALAETAPPVVATALKHPSWPVVAALTFAELGKKINDWSAIAQAIIDLEVAPLERPLAAFTLALLFRNADPVLITKHAAKLFDHCRSYDYFCQAVVAAVDVDRAREAALQGGLAKQIAKYSADSNTSSKQLALLKWRLRHVPVNVPVSPETRLEVASAINADGPQFWHMVLVDGQVPDPRRVAQQLIESKNANGLALVMNAVNDAADAAAILELVLNLPPYTALVMSGLVHLAKVASNSLSDELRQQLSERAISAVGALIHELRAPAIELLAALMPELEVVALIRTIELVPLTLDTARDIQLRFRQFAADFTTKRHLATETTIAQTWLIGQLLNRFQPLWQGVHAALPKIGLLWDICAVYLNGEVIPEQINEDEATFEDEANDDEMDVDEDDDNEDDIEVASESRFASAFEQSAALTSIFTRVDSALIEDLKADEALPTVELMRTQVLKAFVAVPQAVLDYGNTLAGYVASDESRDWTIPERNLAITALLNLPVSSYANGDALKQVALTLLGNMLVATQKLALALLKQYKDLGIVRKYQDTLLLLLDDTLFRDTLSGLEFEHGDVDNVMPFVVRILFGRVQGGNSKGNKVVLHKHAVLSYLPKLERGHLEEFLLVAAQATRFDAERYDMLYMHRLSGYVTLLLQVFGVVRDALLGAAIAPLAQVMATADSILSATSDHEEVVIKAARTVRGLGFKALAMLLNSVSLDWSLYLDDVMAMVSPRLPHFMLENLQQVSGVMLTLTLAATLPVDLGLLVLTTDDFAGARALLSVLSHPEVKPDVAVHVLQFCADVFARQRGDDAYYELVALCVSSVIEHLPAIIPRLEDVDVAVSVLLTIVTREYLDSSAHADQLLVALVLTLNRARSDVLKAMVLLLGPQVSQETYHMIYKALCPLLMKIKDYHLRQDIVTLFSALAVPMASVIAELNALDRGEFDYERRLAAYRQLTDSQYLTLTLFDWLSVVSNAIYYLGVDDLPIYTNAQLVLTKFILVAHEKAKDVFDEVLLPQLQFGLRGTNDRWIEVLAAIVTSGHYSEFADLQPFADNEVFADLTHIQIPQRALAMRKIGEVAPTLGSDSASHYVMPILERYVLDNVDKNSLVSLDALDAVSPVVSRFNWQLFKTIVKRYAKQVKFLEREAGEDGDSTDLKKYVWLLEAASRLFRHLNKPQESVVPYVTKEFVPTVLPLLDKRNDNTISVRLLLAVALAEVIDATDDDVTIAAEMPPVILPTCNVMKSRTGDLRDATRKVLLRIVNLVGPRYLNYIFDQLRATLARGSQIHVLAYTVHYLLTLASLKHQGELDDCVGTIVDVVMEDVFGAAGQEKDAEGYISKMKEVKAKTSFDTIEIVAGHVLLPKFGRVLAPIKMLLREHINHKTQVQLDELIRRVSVGVLKNPASGLVSMLQLCFDVLQIPNEVDAEEAKPKPQVVQNPKRGDESFFVVLMNRKQLLKAWDSTHFKGFFYRFGLEMLRSAVAKHPQLQSVGSMAQFVPLLNQCLANTDELVVMLALRMLDVIVKRGLGASADDVTIATNRALEIISDALSTDEEVCQAALRFLTTVLRHQELVELPDRQVGHIITKCQPDLEDPKAQGSLAFSFIKAVMFRHITIVEVYEVIDDVIAKIMVVNHHPQLRAQARDIYYQFLMEYDQLRGRLDKQFKFLVLNLSYPTEEGRQLVMELLNHILNNHLTTDELVSKLALLLFVALCQVAVADDSSKGRQMASLVVEKLLKRKVDHALLAKYVELWMQLDQPMLKRCGLTTYKIWHLARGELSLDKVAVKAVSEILQDDNEDWEFVYVALTVVLHWCTLEREQVFSMLPTEFWTEWLLKCLLFPHPWVRLQALKILGVWLGHQLDDAPADAVQTAAYRLLRQLGTLTLKEDLATQAVKNLVKIAMHWQKTGAPFIKDERLELDYPLALAMLVHRTCGILRQDAHRTDLKVLKQSAMKFAAMLIQIIPEAELTGPAEAIVLALHIYIEPGEGDLHDLALEVQQVLESKLGVTEYSRLHAQVYQQISQRRLERKLKRAQLAVTAPEAAAKQKIKKHMKEREKRKNQKDENGYYHTKKKRRL